MALLYRPCRISIDCRPDLINLLRLQSSPLFFIFDLQIVDDSRPPVECLFMAGYCLMLTAYTRRTPQGSDRQHTTRFCRSVSFSECLHLPKKRPLTPDPHYREIMEGRPPLFAYFHVHERLFCRHRTSRLSIDPRLPAACCVGVTRDFVKSVDLAFSAPRRCQLLELMRLPTRRPASRRTMSCSCGALSNTGQNHVEECLGAR